MAHNEQDGSLGTHLAHEGQHGRFMSLPSGIHSLLIVLVAFVILGPSGSSLLAVGLAIGLPLPLFTLGDIPV